MKCHVGKISLLMVGVALVTGLCGTTAFAVDTSLATLRFTGVSSTSAANTTIGTNQFLVEVLPVTTAGQETFRLQNVGTSPSSITGFFFDDERLAEAEATNGVITGFTTNTLTAPGVTFIVPATTPVFTGGTTVTPVFVTTNGLALTANTSALGVGPGETLLITTNLRPGVTNEDILEALQTGALRVGVQAQGFTAPGTETFATSPRTVTVIPAPAAILLGSLGAGLVGLLRRRRML